jgi:hypothetical protein
MGLDQYAFTVPDHGAMPDTDFSPKYPADADDPCIRLMYWRKHPDLHGWMERLYRSRGGSKEQFNCATVRLRREDLDALREDVYENRLPATQGFFFGTSDPSRNSETLQFIDRAMSALDSGFAVYYDSWW